MEMPQIYRPSPRRPFEWSPASIESSVPPSPAPENQNPELLSDKLGHLSPSSRTVSILNLTSSTLLGIYSKTGGDATRDDPPTPWGTGSQTPAMRPSLDSPDRPDLLSAKWEPVKAKPRALSMRKNRSGFRGYYMPLLLQTCFLFVFGMGFGVLVTHLQRTQQITPLPIPRFARTPWSVRVSWGLLGVMVGNALPRIDAMWADESAIEEGDGPVQLQGIARRRSTGSELKRSLADSGTGPFWHSAVRSVGAFVGIAFAVRKVPWQSTLQVSLTLAAANPVLWYIIDRSKSGFALSSVVGILGTFLLLLVNPDFVPVPAIHHSEQTLERFGVYTWLASILFCTSLCFGAIGRRLQL